MLDGAETARDGPWVPLAFSQGSFRREATVGSCMWNGLETRQATSRRLSTLPVILQLARCFDTAVDASFALATSRGHADRRAGRRKRRRA